eukprot:gene7561-7768_t
MRMGFIPGSNVGGRTEEGVEALVSAIAAGWPQRATAVGDQCYQTPVTMGCRTCFYSDPGARQALSRRVSPAGAGAGNSLGGTGVSALVPEALALQSRTIKCSLCGQDILGIVILRHNELCGVLVTELSKLKGGLATADARMTVLAKWIEDQLQHGVWPPSLHHHLHQIVSAARLAVSLQPDGTSMPLVRCSQTLEALQMIHDQWKEEMHRLTITQSNPEALAEGAADCDIVVSLCWRLMKSMGSKLAWLSEPLPWAGAQGPADVPNVAAVLKRGLLHVPLLLLPPLHVAAASSALSAPVMQVTDFEMICPISRGAYGRVYKVKKKSTGDTFAIKVLTKTELVRKNMVESVTNERNILAMANNPFVVRFYYSFSSPEKLFLVMEYCPGGDLSSVLQHLGRFSEEMTKQYIAETVLALEYCHSKGIIHQACLSPAAQALQLKKWASMIPHTSLPSSPAVFLGGNPAYAADAGRGAGAAARAWCNDAADNSRGQVSVDRGVDNSSSLSKSGVGSGGTAQQFSHVLLDLAMAALASMRLLRKKLKHASQAAPKALGTPDYLAPEMLMGMDYGPEVDWWALGIVLYEFMYGAPPFNDDTPQQIFERILDCNVEFIKDEGEHVLSEEGRDLISQLLQGDPRKRLGHRGAGEVKLHPWFKGIEWESLARQKAAFVPQENSPYFASCASNSGGNAQVGVSGSYGSSSWGTQHAGGIVTV